MLAFKKNVEFATKRRWSRWKQLDPIVWHVCVWTFYGDLPRRSSEDGALVYGRSTLSASAVISWWRSCLRPSCHSVNCRFTLCRARRPVMKTGGDLCCSSQSVLISLFSLQFLQISHLYLKCLPDFFLFPQLQFVYRCSNFRVLQLNLYSWFFYQDFCRKHFPLFRKMSCFPCQVYAGILLE